MTITLELPHDIEPRLEALAAARGIAPTECLVQVVRDALADGAQANGAHVPASFAAMSERSFQLPAPEANARTIALLEELLARGVSEDPEELRQAEAEFDDLMAGINENRRIAGARLL